MYEKLFFERLFKKFDQKNGLALDVGCGYGFFTNLLNNIGCTTYGLDLDSNRIVESQKKYKLNFVIGDSTRQPFPNNSFNLVLCRGLSTFYPDDLENALEQRDVIYDLLKKDGLLVLIFSSNLTGKKTSIQNHQIEDVVSFIKKSGYETSVYFLSAKNYLLRILGGFVFSSLITYLSVVFTKITKRSGYIVCIIKKR